MSEDGAFKLLKSRAGFESELIGECPPSISIDLERLRLPAGPVEGKHQLPAQPFA